jgi:2-methylcitrate dehydratase PrpD
MIIKKYAEFIRNTHYQEIPEDVIEKAKLCFLDFLGVTLRGSKSSSALTVNKFMSKVNESTIIGHEKSSVLNSALANGIAAHSLDLDDGHRIAHIHPGACIIPAALSICEINNSDGKELISSIVVGYEIAISLGKLVNPEHRNRGFHTTGTCGTFGAVAAACNALNLNNEQILNAIGLAGTQASGLLESDHAGSMGKHLHTGKAAESGVLSALLASRGFTGASSIIDGNEGFLAATAGLNVLKKKIDMGNFHILNVYFKKYPVCRHLHSTIDAVLDIMKNNDLNVEKIKKIIVKTYKIAANHNNYNPNSIEALRQSLPLSLAITIKKNDLNIDNLEIDNDIIDISRKIIIECDQHLDDQYPQKRISQVTIQTIDQSYSNTIDLPKGEPENQYTKSELVDKFYNLNNEINIDILDIIDNLENYNVKNLMRKLNSKSIHL